MQNCYELPHLNKVDMPIRVEVAEVVEDCSLQTLPTPKTACWEEERMLCPKGVPQLVEREAKVYKCDYRLTDTRCTKIKLTIPKEVCFPQERYYPYPPTYGYPATN